MRDIKTTSISDHLVSRFFEKNCIVINHAAPLSVQDDEQALKYVWHHVMCAENHWNLHFLCTPQGNVYKVNSMLLHYYFDHGRMTFQEFQKSLYVDEYQLIENLPDAGSDTPRMINFCGVTGVR